MKRILKAYKCIFPDRLEEEYTKSSWYNKDCYEVIYGESQKGAVKEKCLFDEFEGYFQLKSQIKTRRFQEMDLYMPNRSSLLDTLSDKQIGHLTHSLGVSKGDVLPESFYRNHSMYYSASRDCDFLVSIGLMDRWQNRHKQNVYNVTSKGMEAVRSLLLTTI